MSRNIDQWVDYIQSLHSRSIDLSLERVSQVYAKLLPKGLTCPVVSIAGTNGKGSTAELLASILRACNLRVGKYTSPHLRRFNERFNVDGHEVDDSLLLEEFERVEAARGDVSLTFFEFGTLVGISLFERAALDVAVMEVGLGGRLDAVNILQPSVTIITNIGIDHTAWLGETLTEISREKFGITRSGVPCVIGMYDPPSTLTELAKQQKVPVSQIGQEFDAHLNSASDPNSGWQYTQGDRVVRNLPLPFAQSGHQLSNSAVAINAAINLLGDERVSSASLRQGLTNARNPARCQIIEQKPLIMVDVAHNVASVAALAETVAKLPIQGQVHALCGMLKDKQIKLALAEIHDQIDIWHFATIDNVRGATANRLADRLFELNPGHQQVNTYDSVKTAYATVKKKLTDDDALIVFGSFFVAGDIIRPVAFV